MGYKQNVNSMDELGMVVIAHARRNGISREQIVEHYFGESQKAEMELRNLERKGKISAYDNCKGMNNLGHYLALALDPKGHC